MNNNRYNKHQRGFILMEGLITFVVLAVGMIGVAKFQGSTLHRNAETKTHTEAVNLAQEKVEELRNFVDDTAFTNMVAGTDPAVVNAGGNTSFVRSWTVTPNANPSYDTIRVTVTWTDAEGDRKSAELTSIVADANPVESAQLMLIPGYLDTPANPETEGGEEYVGEDPVEDPNQDPTEDPVEDPGQDAGAGEIYTSTTTTTAAVTTTTAAVTTTTTTTVATTTTTLGSYYISISGSFTLWGDPNNVSINVSATGNYSASCYNSISSYECDIGPIAAGSAWTGNVSVSTNKTYCSSNPANPTAYVGITEGQMQNYDIGKNQQKCP